MFDRVISKLASPPILALPKESRPIMIYTDDINFAVREVLMQQQDESNPTQWGTLGYWYKTLSKAEWN